MNINLFSAKTAAEKSTEQHNKIIAKEVLKAKKEINSKIGWEIYFGEFNVVIEEFYSRRLQKPDRFMPETKKLIEEWLISNEYQIKNETCDLRIMWERAK